MSISFEEVKRYLPHYLSAPSQHDLFKELKSFPENIDQRLYSSFSIEDTLIYQGDGIDGLLVINLPDTETREAPAVVFSNSCDIDRRNKRFFPSRLVYAPILQLEKYYAMLVGEFVEKGQYSKEEIENHVLTIKKQYYTQILFLPKGSGLKEDSIVFLDRINNCRADIYPTDEIGKRRLFSLSNYGLYLFLVKLSIHFNRIREGVDRTISN